MDTRTTDGRLAAWIFDLPVVELRAGYRAAVYFDRSRRILAAEDADTRVTMQVFQRSDAMVACGIDEALRSEEHTSELQSRQYLVCRLLLEKKKIQQHLRD